MISQVRSTYNFFFSGANLYEESVFNLENLEKKFFRKFLMSKTFGLDSDIFTEYFSCFLIKYDSSGFFFISSAFPKSEYLKIPNSVNYLEICKTVQDYNNAMTLMYFCLYDENKNWCIYVNSDMQMFISWCTEVLIKDFESFFAKENDDFFIEKDNSRFLDWIVNTASYQKDFDGEGDKKKILQYNGYLFNTL